MKYLQFADSPTNRQDGGHISCEFHLFLFLFRFAFEHEWLAFLHVFASTWHLLCPSAFSCTSGIGDSNSSKCNTRGTTRKLRQDLGSKLWEHFPLVDTGHSTTSCWGNLEEQSSSSQGSGYIFESTNTSNTPNARYNRYRICWTSSSQLARPLKLASWNTQDTRMPQAKSTTSVVQNSWLAEKIQFFPTLNKVSSARFSGCFLLNPLLAIDSLMPEAICVISSRPTVHLRSNRFRSVRETIWMLRKGRVDDLLLK